MKKKVTKKATKTASASGRQYWGQTIRVKGLSQAALKRLKILVETEVGQNGGVTTFEAPQPSCGGSGDPC